MSFEAEMRRFEAEVRTNSGNNLARPAGPVGNIYAASSTGFNPFRPHQQPTSLPSTESQIARSSAPKSVSLVDRTIGAGPSATIKEESLVKAKKMKRVVRTGGGQMWEDNSLKDWDPNDFRIFAGDLGNDVTDEVLTRTFGRYPSFQRAKVIRDKKNNKTKGYGFVSFKDPQDFTRAIRELNGKYVGSRPIKLRKSNWKDRNIEVVRQKQKLKQAMGYKF